MVFTWYTKSNDFLGLPVLQLTRKVRWVTLTGVDTFYEREDEHDDDDEDGENHTHDECCLHAADSCGLEQL